MKIEAGKEVFQETGVSLRYTARTPLGRKLLAIRKKIVAAGTPLLKLEEIDKEVAVRKGDRDSNPNDTNLP